MKKGTILIIAIMVFLICLSGCAGEKATGTAVSVPTATEPAPDTAKKEPAAHDFPISLLNFEALERGVDKIDLSTAETLCVTVNHCEYGEPEQVFHDPAVIAAAAEAIGKIRVTGDHDTIDSTASIYGFIFEDADGESIASFGFQYDEVLLLLKAEGRYPIEGTKELFSIEGILLSNRDWRDYYDGLIPAPGLEEWSE